MTDGELFLSVERKVKYKICGLVVGVLQYVIHVLNLVYKRIGVRFMVVYGFERL